MQIQHLHAGLNPRFKCAVPHLNRGFNPRFWKAGLEGLGRRRPASEAVRTFGSDAKGFLMPPNAAALARSRTCFEEGSLAPLRAHGPR